MSPAPRRRGPRGDVDDTRTAILEAARRRFAEHGYDATRLRDVAADADVDVALVSYFFGNKHGLFAAAMALAANPAEIVTELVREGPDGLGERLVRTFLQILDDPVSGTPLVALVRSAATNDHAAEALRGFIEQELLGRVAAAIDAPDASLRASLCGSQMVGLVMARYVVKVGPLAAADRDTLVAALAPTIQRYLTGAID